MRLWPFSKKSARVSGDGFAVRGFAAAEVSSMLAPWHWDGGFTNSEIAPALATIRQRSRDMAKNSEYFVRWLQLFVANVVGPNGFRLKSLAERSDMDVALDAAASFFVETHWSRWAASRSADVSGRLDLPSILRLAAENWARDGEAFIVIDRHAQNAYGIALRVVRPDCVDEMMNVETRESRIVRMGVELDRSTWRPTAYFFDANRSDTWSVTGGASEKVRIPAEDVIHLFTAHDAMQIRGVPLSHAFLKKLKMVDEFDIAELVAARDEANTLGVYKAPAGRETEIRNLAKDGCTRDRLEQKSAPGSRIVLPQGWDYEPKTPHHPNAGLPSFKAAMLRDIASGGGVEYANFANDWAGVSYSSVRAGTLAERDQWLTLQAAFASQVMEPIFEAWLASFLSLRTSGFYGVNDFSRLLPHEFRGRRWEWVDPLKDVNAAVVAVEHGWKTDAEIASDYGGDIDDNIVEAARVKSAKEAAGLTSDATAAGSQADEAEEE